MNKKLLFSLTAICAVSFGIAYLVKYETLIDTFGGFIFGAMLGAGITLSISDLRSDFPSNTGRRLVRFGAILVTAIVGALLVAVLMHGKAGIYVSSSEVQEHMNKIHGSARWFTVVLISLLLMARLQLSKQN